MAVDNSKPRAIVPVHMAYTTFRENFLRVIAVIGLIAILLLGAWGIIQLAFYLPTFFGSLGKPKEFINITVPAQMTADKASVVSWNHGNKGSEQYSYGIRYDCAVGASFATPVPNGEYKVVPCDQAFNFTNATSSVVVIPVLTGGSKQASTAFTVEATRKSDGIVTTRDTKRTTLSVAATSTATSTIKPAETKPAAKPASKPASTYVPSGRTTNLYGAADLVIQVTQAPQAVGAGQRVTLQFVITNAGTNVAPAGWSFVATLPYNPIYTYPAGGQQALYPGDKIIYTLSYDAVRTGDYYTYSQNYFGQAQATIQVDPTNYVAEYNEQNNFASVTYQVY